MSPASAHSTSEAPTDPDQCRTMPGEAKIPLPMISFRVQGIEWRI
jgi:hypothetical protein